MKEQLTGKCKTCIYRSKCFGECPNTRLTMRDQTTEDLEELFATVDILVKYGVYQEASCRETGGMFLNEVLAGEEEN